MSDEEGSVSLVMKQYGETPKARRMAPNSNLKHRVWLPKSQIRATQISEHSLYIVLMPYWLAERAELLQFLSIDDDGKFVRDGQPLWTGARKLDWD